MSAHVRGDELVQIREVQCSLMAGLTNLVVINQLWPADLAWSGGPTECEPINNDHITRW